jgi:hypothetical protein
MQGTRLLGHNSWERTGGPRQLKRTVRERMITAGKRRQDDPNMTGKDS